MLYSTETINDYYKILNVDKNATLEEIKKSYRKLAIIHHPDKGGDSNTFKKIATAYNELINYINSKSDFYDSSVMNDWQYYQDLYEQITIHISISLEESFLGCKRFISIKGTSQEFDIPAGIEDKQLLLFKNNDNSVKLLISVIPKKNYNRIGQDLLIDHEIDFFDAILGGYTTINCIGELIKIKIKENTKPNSKVKISNKGFMHYMNNEWRGDIIITYKYNIPDFTTEKEKDLFKLLKDESKGNNN